MNWDPQRVATVRALEEDLTEAELMARDEAGDAELLAARTPQEFAKIFLRQYRECADHEVISAEQSNREIREMLDELDERDSRRADAARATWSSPPDGTAV